MVAKKPLICMEGMEVSKGNYTFHTGLLLLVTAKLFLRSKDLFNNIDLLA